MLRFVTDGIRLLMRWGRDAVSLVFPNYCMTCGGRMDAGESYVCSRCFLALPFTHIHGERGNVVERLFWGRIPIERANALLCYSEAANVKHLFFRLKYGNRPDVGHSWGRIMARDLLDTDFFTGVDMVIPLPLHVRKQRRRGYNQSEALAQGVCELTGLPMNTTAMKRVVDNPTQTRLTHEERRANVANIFRLERPAEVEGRHVLLIDDVLTTNATLLSCAKELARAPGVRISILVMGLAGYHPFTAKDYEPWQ